MSHVPGTTGYEKAVDAFARSSFELCFEEINKDFLAFIPSTPCRVLDAGAGVGQNAAALAKRGHQVLAVEPFDAFLQIAKDTYQDPRITWVRDSLPALIAVKLDTKPFDFILLDGVWHHLSRDDRRQCIQRFSTLLNIGGICAISLRHGPAGLGTHMYPVDCGELTELAQAYGFKVILQLENQPSKLPNKQHVVWSRIAIRKTAELSP